ncbi:hypothetical protein AHiyo1_23820 [Arthrobacter sp. Hiyo1]|uniref:DUF2848 family protein n=1 Tax=Arthrobacter sp. Hiyo1 TaxID=1588020 RepID=UPI0006A34E7A|nr:DUF2848 family protein [Arthrobacter sp. Hiyo1]GAP59150.1 hypothetical protein AHiyo1_23820 [Arthrobacter sp. Hiyo1]
MTTLSFELPDGTTRNVQVKHLLNAGYAGREQEEVQAHIAELAELGVPGPTTTPALYRCRLIWPSRFRKSASSTAGPRAKRNGRS